MQTTLETIEYLQEEMYKDITPITIKNKCGKETYIYHKNIERKSKYQEQINKIEQEERLKRFTE